MASGGTEAFPELGHHCQKSDCHQLDFLPFKCHGCHKMFCLEHRVQDTHECPKAGYNSRKVVVCETCSASFEITGKAGQDEHEILKQHEKSGNCDPILKKKPTCGATRCKEILTFSNTSTCKACQMKVCLRHRFPGDHGCGEGTKAGSMSVGAAVGSGVKNGDRFLMALMHRNGKDCGKSGRTGRTSPPRTPRSTKAY